MIVAKEMRKQARSSLNGKWGKAVLIALIFTLITGILGFLGDIGNKAETDIYTTSNYLYRIQNSNSNENLKIAGLIFSIINLLVTIPLSYGLVGAYMKLKNGEDVSAFEAVTFGFKNFGRAWKVTLQILLKMLIPIIAFVLAIVIYPFFVLAGLFMLVLGIILLLASIVYLYTESLKYALANFIAIEEKNITSGEAIKKSKLLIKNHRLDFFVLTLTFIGWAILAVLTLGIGILWLIPYIQISQIHFYEKAKQDYNENGKMEEDGLKKEINFQKKILLGVIILVVLPVLLWGAYTIYNQTSCHGFEGISEIEIAQFNEKFLQYEGEKKPGAQVRALLNIILASNANEENEDRIITVNFGNEGEIITSKTSTNYIEGWNPRENIKTTKKYNIQFEYQKNGFINKAIISEK